MKKGKKGDVAKKGGGSIGTNIELSTGGPALLKESVSVKVEEKLPEDSGYHDLIENYSSSEVDSAEEEEKRKIERSIHCANEFDMKSSEIALQALVDANVKDLEFSSVQPMKVSRASTRISNRSQTRVLDAEQKVYEEKERQAAIHKPSKNKVISPQDSEDEDWNDFPSKKLKIAPSSTSKTNKQTVTKKPGNDHVNSPQDSVDAHFEDLADFVPELPGRVLRSSSRMKKCKTMVSNAAGKVDEEDSPVIPQKEKNVSIFTNLSRRTANIPIQRSSVTPESFLNSSGRSSPDNQSNMEQNDDDDNLSVAPRQRLQMNQPKYISRRNGSKYRPKKRASVINAIIEAEDENDRELFSIRNGQVHSYFLNIFLGHK